MNTSLVITVIGPDRPGLVSRLSAADKETAMAAFKAGTTDLLVATTVIEVCLLYTSRCV